VHLGVYRRSVGEGRIDEKREQQQSVDGDDWHRPYDDR
jgi:hypothetical protein